MCCTHDFITHPLIPSDETYTLGCFLLTPPLLEPTVAIVTGKGKWVFNVYTKSMDLMGTVPP
jgi:hypothetical protein